jgi:phospholipid/cholesterol/gamma-HCH transport system ATP-binding protein
MKRRVGLARAIVLNPKYLFCDEPNSGLDPLTARRIDELIQQLTEDFHTTTIVVTHDMRSVQILGDRILFLYDGEPVWKGTRQQLKETSPEEFPPQLRAFLQASGLYV